MKAFYCHSGWCEESAIIFAETRGKAKWQFIEQNCDGDWSDVTCRREKRLDHYGEASKIPFSVLVEMGWWIECYHCGMHVDDSTLYDAGLTPDGVIGNYHSAVYCSQACHDAEQADREAKRRMTNAIVHNLMARLESRLEGADIELVEERIFCDPSKQSVLSARLQVRIDGYEATYGGSMSKGMAFDEWKNQKTHPLMLHQNDLPYFQEKYKLHATLELPNMGKVVGRETFS